MLNTEAIFAGLFGILAPIGPVSGGGDGTFVTMTRRLQLVEDVDGERMPYVGQLQIDRAPVQETFAGVATWIVRAVWYVYVNAPNMDTASTPLLNPAVDAILNLFPQEGGPVFGYMIGTKQVSLAFDGPVKFYEGLLDSKAVAEIPLKLLIPN